MNSGVTGAAIARSDHRQQRHHQFARGTRQPGQPLPVTQCAFPATGALSENAITNSGVMVLAYSTVSGHRGYQGGAGGTACGLFAALS